MIDFCTTEINELHQFFEDWFCGRIPDTDQAFSRLEKSLAPDFEMITPSADILSRPTLLKQLRAMNGAYLNKNKPSSIWIEDISGRNIPDELCLMRYQEWQGTKSKTDGKGRLNSALFRKSADAPNGIEWLHLHEVWI